MTEVYCAFLDRRAEAWWSFVQQKSLDRTSRPMMLLLKVKVKTKKIETSFEIIKIRKKNDGLLSSRSLLTTLPPIDLLAVPLFRIIFLFLI